ncbi:MFS transporter [Gluconobacter albidus]|uniref:MFS transporter n=1 Tax=Gluconobacter albidus TaxID=318683 RepID=A0A149TH16_9PROT|nr:MFS transporter [Gluconobacter albidus]KXV47115.1 MFS transporter [Gluconobacter albidus]
MVLASPRGIIALFASAYVLSFVDRQILALLVGPIKTALLLSDFQFALLNGLAFSLLYSILGLPIAALSDRIARPPIIVAGIIIWSVATISCGFAQNFWQLFICRMAVGVGEAALVPAVYSFLADIVTPYKLGQTLALFSLGSFIGAGIAFLFGGMLIGLLHTTHEWHGIIAWKLCFVCVGLPGLPLALLIALTVRESGRRHASFQKEDTSSETAWGFFRLHWKFFTCHFLGYSSTAIILFSLLSWMPALFLRYRHFSHQSVGEIMGLTAIFCGCAGAYVSGRLIDFLGRRNHPFPAATMGITGALSAPALLWGSIASPNIPFGIMLFAMSFFCAALPMPPSAIVLQQSVPKTVRSQFSAVLLFCNALIGLSGGSMLVGYLDDHVAGVAISLPLVTCGGGLLAALLLYGSTRFDKKVLL